MVDALELPRLLPQLPAARKGHHVDLPDQDGGLGLVELGELGLDIGLDAAAVHDVDQDERIDVAVGKDLGGPRAERAIGTGDEGRPALVGFGGRDRSAGALLGETLPGKVLGQEHRDPKGQDGDDSDADGEQTVVGHCVSLISGLLRRLCRDVSVYRRENLSVRANSGIVGADPCRCRNQDRGRDGVRCPRVSSGSHTTKSRSGYYLAALPCSRPASTITFWTTIFTGGGSIPQTRR